MVATVGHISGGTFNPAITIGLLLTRRIDAERAVVQAYIVAQLFGGLAGVAALTLFYEDIIRNRVNLGAPAISPDLGAGNAQVMEIILTVFIMFVIFGVAIDNRSSRGISGLAMGLTMTPDVFGGGAVSGAVMNPAPPLGRRRR